MELDSRRKVSFSRSELMIDSVSLHFDLGLRTLAQCSLLSLDSLVVHFCDSRGPQFLLPDYSIADLPAIRPEKSSRMLSHLRRTRHCG